MAIARKFLASAILLSGVALLADPATAGSTHIPAACVDDAAKLCKRIKPGGGRVLECLTKKDKVLGAECRTAIKPMRNSVVAWRHTCGRDIDKYCGDAPHGARVVACLRKNVSQLSSRCKVKFKNKPLGALMGCVDDIAELCTGVKPGGGRVLECLISSKKAKSRSCNGHLRLVKRLVTDWRNACGPEIDRHCGKTTPGWGMLACMEKRSGLSDKCQAHLKKAEGSYTHACRHDVREHCSKVKPGVGRVHKCIQAHYDELRPDCAATVLPRWAS